LPTDETMPFEEREKEDDDDEVYGESLRKFN